MGDHNLQSGGTSTIGIVLNCMHEFGCHINRISPILVITCYLREKITN